ncbi:MAG: thymidine phosphorylase [Euryarchaeota archaeon]|nr:thymidine phosphorylase [Euryarchaeota archaeon]|tara:strand:+ start:4040 stop:5296 length:1257 start_codon:yes stop_codon:yes gene_type:complete
MRLMPDILAAKRDGEELTTSDFQYICNNIMQIPREQLGAFLMACQINGLSTQETSDLTRAMLNAGDRMESMEGRVDKHSTGGVGDKMSIILAPALRAAGATVPMLAGRGLAHTGGTIDKLEAIPGFNTGLSMDEMKDNPCFISRQTEDIAPADRILYSIRDITATVPQIGLITASIISKKAAEGLEKLVLDVKCGNAAFMQTKEDAVALAKSMVATGNSLGMKVTAQVTEMDNPIGMMFGNSHEIVECIQCLKGEGPEDTMELVYAQSDSLGYDIRANIADGSALAEFRNMCMRQGVSEKDIDEIIHNPWGKLERSPNSVEIVSTSSGWITDIHALTIGEILCKLGAGRTGENPEINHGVGAELLVQRGSFIEEGNAWIRFDTESEMSSEMIDQVQDALTVSDSEVEIKGRILQIIEE